MSPQTSEQAAWKTRWSLLALILAIIGLLLSWYAANHHFELLSQGHTDAACNVNATINCDAVASSPYATVLGWPLGIWGMGFFAAMAVLAGLMRSKEAKVWTAAYLCATCAGVLASVTLAGIAFFLIGSLCLVCLGVYAVCLAAGATAWYAVKRLSFDAKQCFTLKPILISFVLSMIGSGLSSLLFAGQDTANPTVEEPASGDVPSHLTSTEIAVDVSAYSGFGEDYRKGSDSASVTIVEFADFQCPACRRASIDILKRIHDRFGDQVRIVFKNFPLNRDCNDAVGSAMHPEACTAALLARCAGREGKFWEYHDLVFERQAAISQDNLIQWAVELGLKKEAAERCLNDASLIAKIKDDASLGQSIGVNGTPAIYINGRESRYRDYVDLELQIESLIR